MQVLVHDYPHRTGEHCASTALRNILHFHGVEKSEDMIVGVAGGLGFAYLALPGASPSRMFHGRTATLEQDFCDNAGIPFEDRLEPDDARAWTALRRRLDAGQPVMISTDTYYLEYHRTSSHFPGHRAVVVGYDTGEECAWIADRKFAELQRCSFDSLRRARNADDYPMRCVNQYGDFLGEIRPRRLLAESIRIALRRNARHFLTPPGERVFGLGGMRALAEDLPRWGELPDWSWAARFGYQVVIKRGAGGSFFRSLYAGFLREAAARVPALGEEGLPQRMDAIAARWRELAALLEEQSERERCAPELFVRAGAAVGALADEEEAFFLAAARLADRGDAWPTPAEQDEEQGAAPPASGSGRGRS